MSKLIVPTLSIILVIWLFGGATWYANNHKGPSFKITDGTFNVQSESSFHFQNSSATATFSSSAENAIKELANYLSNHTNRQLNLSGVYSSEENNTSNFENLGLARADAIKTKLVAYGVDESNISLQNLQVDQLNEIGNQLYGMVHFKFSTKTIQQNIEDQTDEASINEEQSSSGPAPLNIYFGKKQYKFNTTPVLDDYAENVLQFLKDNKAAIIYVTGHSDDSGNTASINRLAKYRSRKVRDFFVRKGIALKRIKIDHKGADSPLGPNDTEEGRKKNRRVEVRVK